MKIGAREYSMKVSMFNLGLNCVVGSNLGKHKDVLYDSYCSYARCAALTGGNTLA